MVIEVKKLTKSYGNVKALKGIDIRFTNGIYGLLGPNGSGKSTFMNILTDNLSHDGGEILCDGENIKTMGERYRGMLGYMPQETIVYDSFSALEFMRYMAMLKGMNLRNADTQMHILELLKKVNLLDECKRKAGGFSGGMKRRLLLAQALINDPRILILDEPTAGLDPKERIAMRNMIMELSSDRIVLLATHIVADIECVADKVVLMKQGRIIDAASPKELIHKTAPHVQEIKCKKEDLESLRQSLCVGSIRQCGDYISVHVIDDDEFEKPCDFITLDDTYMYYFELKQNE